jgi:hypothetical protein
VDEEQEIMEANLFMVHLLGKVFSGENITDWLIFGRLLHKRQGR